MKTWIFALALASAAVAYIGCKDDDHHDDTGAHTSTFAVCQELIDACHEVDTGDGPAHDCHEIGHDGKSEAECTSNKERCFKICADAKADAGSSSDGG